MMNKRAFQSRLTASGMTKRKVAELVGAYIGESVSNVEISRIFYSPCSEGKIRKIADAADRITAKAVSKVESKAKISVMEALAIEGMHPDSVKIYLGDYSFGDTIFVFADGLFFGIWRPDIREWRERADGKNGAKKFYD